MVDFKSFHDSYPSVTEQLMNLSDLCGVQFNAKIILETSFKTLKILIDTMIKTRHCNDCMSSKSEKYARNIFVEVQTC